MHTGLAQTRKRLTRPLARPVLVVIQDRQESFRRVRQTNQHHPAHRWTTKNRQLWKG